MKADALKESEEVTAVQTQVYDSIFSQRPSRAATHILSSCITDVDYSDCERVLDFIEQHPEHALSMRIVEALAIIERCFNEYPQMALSFNGGKDATLVLHLVRVYCLRLSEKDSFHPHEIFCSRIVCFVLHTTPEFQALSNFFVWADEHFNLRSKIIQNMTFKSALLDFVNLTRLPMCFMGVRYGDPRAQRVFDYPSPGWPQIHRVSPAFGFSFIDVFDFFLRFDFKYCELYNRGFTSIGDTDTRAHAAITGASIGLRMREEFEAKAAAHESSLLDTSATEIKSEMSPLDSTVADALIGRGITYEQIISRFADENATPAYCISIEESETERSGRIVVKKVGKNENML